MITTKQLRDLAEMIPGNPICNIDGSDQEEIQEGEFPEILLHQQNLLSWIEYEQAKSLHEGFPEEYPDPCLGRRCDECEIGGCEYGVQVVCDL